MNETTNLTSYGELGSVTKDRGQFSKTLGSCVEKCGIDMSGTVLVVGGSFQDIEVLQGAGFKRMTLSNFQPVSTNEIPETHRSDIDVVNADVESMNMPDNSYDFVIAHEVLHHCRSPHVALGEMLRVSRRHVVILEPNDSLLMRMLVATRFSFPYELPSVIYHNCESGGVRNSCVPNFIYRWSRHDVWKSVSCFIPERDFDLYVDSYWDFNAERQDLALRTETRLRSLTSVLGIDGFLRSVRLLQKLLNRIPVLRGQGNKFFCCIEKKDKLKPWLTQQGSEISFNREFAVRK